MMLHYILFTDSMYQNISDYLFIFKLHIIIQEHSSRLFQVHVQNSRRFWKFDQKSS